MNEENIAKLADESSSQPALTSMTLTEIAKPDHPYHKLFPSDKSLACKKCPNAIWTVVDKKNLNCFCNLMRVTSWKTSEPMPIPLCDGILMGTPTED